MPRLTPCPSCDAHVLVDERACPHCGASLRTPNARVPVLLMGLALTGCPQVEPVYGVPESGPNDEMPNDESDTSTETGSDTETTSVGEPEYGVPDSG